MIDGQRSLWADFRNNIIVDAYAKMAANVTVPVGAYMYFTHYHAFDSGPGTNYDGGVLEYSLDGGNTWYDVGYLMTHNGYNGKINTDYSVSLRYRDAFVGTSITIYSIRLYLNPDTPTDAQFRFYVATDDLPTGHIGWAIDNIRIYTCTGQP